MTKYALIDMDPSTHYGWIASIHDDVVDALRKHTGMQAYGGGRYRADSRGPALQQGQRLTEIADDGKIGDRVRHVWPDLSADDVSRWEKAIGVAS